SPQSTQILRSHQHLRHVFAYDLHSGLPCELFALSSAPSASAAVADRLVSPPGPQVLPNVAFLPARCPNPATTPSSTAVGKHTPKPEASSSPSTGSSASSSLSASSASATASALAQALLPRLQPKRQAQGLCSVCISALSFDEDSKFVQCFRCSTVNLPVDRIAAQVECPGCRRKLHIMQASPITSCDACQISLVVMECQECTNPFVYLKGVPAIHCSRCRAPQIETRDLSRTTVHHLINADVNDPPSARLNTNRRLAADAKPIALLVQYYQDKSEERQRELDEALANNVANRWISKIVVLLEREEDRAVCTDKFVSLPDGDKISLHTHGKRLFYSEAFAFANEHLLGCTVILSNLDIFFDSSLMHLRLPRPESAPPSVFYTLSRYEVEPEGKVIFKESFAPLSQDAWIFSPPLPAEFVEACDFSMGLPGCDNRIVYECQNKGKPHFLTHNPSLKIVARHLHRSNVRNYLPADAIKGKYAYIPPSFGLWPE
ncbi:MAG: hypothetical protein Q8P67_11585, partial [archaeon]|nr:hypothetical protein [archaeon]